MDLDPNLLAQVKLAAASFAGGVVRLFLRPATSILRSIWLVVCCVVCGYYFTHPVMMLMGLSDDWAPTIGALLGLVGVSVAEALLDLDWREFVNAWIVPKNPGK